MGEDAWLSAAPPRAVGGAGLQLRAWARSDAAEITRIIIASQPELSPFMPWAGDYDLDKAAEFLEHAQRAWQRHEEYLYAVTDPDGALLGGCGLHARIGRGGLEIGYWIRSDRHRRGIATRAAAVVTATAFELDDVTHVEIRHDPANRISGRIPRRLGFTHVDTIEAEPEAPGETGERFVWRLDRDAFAASTAAELAAST